MTDNHIRNMRLNQIKEMIDLQDRMRETEDQVCIECMQRRYNQMQYDLDEFDAIVRKQRSNEK